MRYFDYSEFDSPDLPNSGEMYMDRHFLQMLDDARGQAGIAFKITSGYRTENHNRKVGGVRNSSHTKGLAADIACSNGSNRFTIVNALIMAGFNRIGIAKNFIHCDIDGSKSPYVVWTY